MLLRECEPVHRLRYVRFEINRQKTLTQSIGSYTLCSYGAGAGGNLPRYVCVRHGALAPPSQVPTGRSGAGVTPTYALTLPTQFMTLNPITMSSNIPEPELYYTTPNLHCPNSRLPVLVYRQVLPADRSEPSSSRGTGEERLEPWRHIQALSQCTFPQQHSRTLRRPTRQYILYVRRWAAG